MAFQKKIMHKMRVVKQHHRLRYHVSDSRIPDVGSPYDN